MLLIDINLLITRSPLGALKKLTVLAHANSHFTHLLAFWFFFSCLLTFNNWDCILCPFLPLQTLTLSFCGTSQLELPALFSSHHWKPNSLLAKVQNSHLAQQEFKKRWVADWTLKISYSLLKFSQNMTTLVKVMFAKLKVNTHSKEITNQQYHISYSYVSHPCHLLETYPSGLRFSDKQAFYIWESHDVPSM